MRPFLRNRCISCLLVLALGVCTFQVGGGEVSPEDCSDGKDNDGDLLTDCEDPSCLREPECACLDAPLNLIFQETPPVGADGV